MKDRPKNFRFYVQGYTLIMEKIMVTSAVID